MNKKYILILLLGLVLIFSGFYYLSLNNESNIETREEENIIIEEENTNQEENNQSNTNTNTNTEKEDNNKTESKIVLDPNNKKASCENYGGVWIEKKSICEINSYSENQCVAKGGEFNPCDSACRHDEEAEICTLQCVLTCTFR